jgi:hypothetical protein
VRLHPKEYQHIERQEREARELVAMALARHRKG